MNSTVQIAFGLLGGLALFLFGMNLMSECLQKAAGEKMKAILALLTKNPILGVLAGAFTEQQCDNSYGDRFCQCGTYESSAGNFYYTWCQHWYNNDGADHCI